MRTLSLYGSRFSVGGFTFDTLPNVSVRNLRVTGGRRPIVTSPAPLYVADDQATFYASTRYRALACGTYTVIDVTGSVFIGSRSVGGRVVDLGGRTFRLRARLGGHGTYVVVLDIASARYHRIYYGVHGTINRQR